MGAQISREQLRADIESLDIRQFTLATLADVTPSAVSLWRNGHRGLTESNARKVASLILRLKAIQAKFEGVKIDMNNVPFLRKELRKLDDGDGALIPQEFGIEFAEQWSKQFGFTLEEIFAMPQFHRRILRATVLSRPAQRWFRAFTVSVETILAGANFTEYSKRFTDRHSAMTCLANAAFAGLLAECGKTKLLSYVAALITTGELRQAPTDSDEN